MYVLHCWHFTISSVAVETGLFFRGLFFRGLRLVSRFLIIR